MEIEIFIINAQSCMIDHIRDAKHRLSRAKDIFKNLRLLRVLQLLTRCLPPFRFGYTKSPPPLPPESQIFVENLHGLQCLFDF